SFKVYCPCSSKNRTVIEELLPILYPSRRAAATRLNTTADVCHHVAEDEVDNRDENIRFRPQADVLRLRGHALGHTEEVGETYQRYQRRIFEQGDCLSNQRRNDRTQRLWQRDQHRHLQIAQAERTGSFFLSRWN